MNHSKITVEVLAGEMEGWLFDLPYNPGEYTEALRNKYERRELMGLRNAIEQFESAQKEDLSLSLLFDTTATGEDVRDQMQDLTDISEIDAELHAPPPCRFIWGSLVFQGVVARYARRFTYFYSDGTPARAHVTLVLKPYQSTEEIIRETQLHSSDVTKYHRLREGESLFLLAQKAYEKPGLWRKIAEANDIDDPLNLSPGSSIMIPPKDR